MSRARTVARGAAWNYLAQILTVVLQLSYASFTSRLLGPELFGVFAAAIASVTFVNLIALAGLPQIVGRMETIEPGRMLGLLIYGGLVGVVAAVFLLATADLWALLWDVPESAEVLRLLALSSLVTPLSALGSGVLMRLGLFRRLATITFAANFLGMGVAALAVFITRSAEALALSMVVTQAVVAAAAVLSSHRSFVGRPSLRDTLGDIGYSGRTAVSGTLSYWAGAVSKVGLSHIFGPAALGSWNRAEAIATVPFYQLYTALSQAIYPEFRHAQEPDERTRRIWSDMLAIVGWVCFPLGALAAVLMPTAVHILFGEGWGGAVVMAQCLALAGGLQPVVFLLIGGLESLGKFPLLWGGYLISLGVNIGGVVVGALTGSVIPINIGIIAAMLAMHGFHLTRLSAMGMLEMRLVLVRYAQIGGFAVLLASTAYIAINAAAVWALNPWLVAAPPVAAAVAAFLTWRSRSGFPPLRLARTYGLLKG